MNKDICCPEFNPTNWEDKLVIWEKKNFIQMKTKTFFYIPLNFGKTMTKLQELLEKAEAKNTDFMCLTSQNSKWNMDLYLAVDREIEGANNVSLSGTFYSKVYEGSFNNVGIWMKDFEKVLKDKEYKSKNTYMWYTTCPKCAKKYGKNYVVLIADICN